MDDFEDIIVLFRQHVAWREGEYGVLRDAPLIQDIASVRGISHEEAAELRTQVVYAVNGTHHDQVHRRGLPPGPPEVTRIYLVPLPAMAEVDES